MKIKQFFQVAISMLVAAFFVALAVAGIARATTVGTNISTGTVTLTSTTNPQLTAKYDGTNFYTIGSDASGTTTLEAYGGVNASFLFNDPVRIATSSTTALEVRGGASNGPNIFVVDGTNGRVGVGIPVPSFPFHLASTTANQFVVGYNTTNYLAFNVDSGGTTTLQSVGGAYASLLAVDPFRIASSSTTAFEIRNASGNETLVVNSTVGYVGIGNLTPSYALHVATTSATQFVLGYDGTNYLAFSVGSAGTTTLNAVGGATASLSVLDPIRIATTSTSALQVRDGNQNAILSVDASAGYVGIGTSTAPSYVLHVATSTTPQFALMYNTTNYLTFSTDASGTTTINAVGGTATPGLLVTDPFRIDTSTTDAFEVRNIDGTGTTTFTVDTRNNRVGIGSSTPSAMLSVGGDQSAGGVTSSVASTTIDFGRACFRSMDSNGTTFYWWFDLNDGSLIATSTTKCSPNL